MTASISLTTVEITAVNDQPPTSDNVIVVRSKGEFIASGTTSLVERLPSGDVIKTPWAGDIREEDCRKEIAIEAQVYARLGEHARLAKMKHWDSEAYTLTLEYMPNGTLESYLRSHFEQIPSPQKLRWISQAAEAVSLLHSNGIVHCDIGPHNFLLDANLDLKIADFSGSSLDGSPAMVCAGPAKVEEDLFALGSTIYYIVTGKAPYEELPDDQVTDEFLDGTFPDLTNLLCGEVITLCWHCEAHLAQEIRGIVDARFEQKVTES
ncbi:kinase-like domain-containing protein [Ilyonectria sp. MPI-CAGE-AT-0026]|nr:kinase-like domain-containing protein [Ilyonectria sp. MPI-CAGE-AT-0026]